MKSRSYTSREYEAIREELLEKARLRTPEWNDFSDSDLGVVFLELLAGTSDMLHFYLDRVADENFIDTAVEESSIVSLLQLMNYKMKLVNPACTTVKASIPPDYPVKVKIPKYTTLSTNNGVTAYTLKESYLGNGVTEVEIPVNQGLPHSIKVDYEDLDYKIPLPRLNILRGTIDLKIDGESWEEVEDAFLKYEGGKYFSVHLDKKSPYLLLSCNYEELILDGAMVEIYFGVHSVGRIPENSLVRFRDNLYDMITGDLVNIEVTNSQSATGYYERDINLEKAKGLASVKLMDKLVTLEDYRNYMYGTPGVLKCQTLDWSSLDSPVKSPYQVNSYIALNDSDKPSQEFIDRIYEDTKSKSILANKLNIYPPNLKEFELKVKLKIRGNENQGLSIKNKVEEFLSNKFSRENIEFDQNLILAEILGDILRISSAIKTVDIVSPSEDIMVDRTELLRCSNLVVQYEVQDYGY